MSQAMSQTMSAPGGYARYTAVAVVLHWIIALAIIVQIAAGLQLGAALESTDEATRFEAFRNVQTHKSMGLTVLALSLLRLIWRLTHALPQLPTAMPSWQKLASHLSHWAFYGAMIGLPLTGWAMASTSPRFSDVPTIYFGLFQIPHLPLPGWIAPLANDAHFLIAMATIALLVLHVGAALKHHFVDGDAILARMAPWVSPRRPVTDEPAPARPSVASRALAVGVLAGVAMLVFVLGDHGRDGGTVASVEAVEVGGDAAAPAGGAALWAVAEDSKIGFSGTNSGAPFEGVFERWRAEIRFDPDDLGASSVRVVIETASAKTGDVTYDGTLPNADWFDAAAHPEAVFEADRFEAAGEPGQYVAHGALTIKGVRQDLSLPFTLVIEGDQARMTASTVLDRLALGLGVAADADGSWVSTEIPVAIEVTATRSGDGA